MVPFGGTTVRFEQTLIEGTLISRDKRFSAAVKLNNGEEIQAHCANAGSLIGCSEPGSKVLLSKHESAHSRYSHHLEIVYSGRTPVAIHAGRQAAVIAEAVTDARIPELAGYASLRRDTRGNRETRMDLVIEGNALRPCYMKIENVTCVEEGTSLFPDIVIDEGQQVMTDLTNLVREGNRAMIMLLVQRADAERFKLADKVDAEFTQAFRDAAARGVEVVCYRSRVTKRGIELDVPLPMDLAEA